jgi:hypothetical protein
LRIEKCPCGPSTGRRVCHRKSPILLKANEFDGNNKVAAKSSTSP